MATISNGSKLEKGIVAGLVKPGSAVLDLGCGDGDLLHTLVTTKGIRGQGIEIDDRAVFRCVEKGLTVLHQDIDEALPEYGDDAFDYVILNFTLQQVRKPDCVLQESLRVGREVILGLPNFAFWRARVQIFFRGRTPVTRSLPYTWHDTPNLHFLSIRDFREYCDEMRITVRDFIALGEHRRERLLPNLTAESAIFRLARLEGRG